MSEKDKIIREFIEAVYPEAPDLAMATFNEIICLQDATEIIMGLTQEVQALEFLSELRLERIQQAEARVKELEAHNKQLERIANEWTDRALEAEGRIKTLETEKNAISKALNKVVERSIQHAMDVVNRKITDI